MLKATRLPACAALLLMPFMSPQFAAARVSGDTGQIRVFIDAPAPQTNPADTVTFSGWALDSAAAVTEVTLAIDEVPVGTAFYGITRSEVCAIYSNPPGCPNIGWTIAVDTRVFASGTHSLSVTGTSGAGNQASVTRQFTLGKSAGTANASAATAGPLDAAGDFQLAISPAALTIDVGNTGIATVDVTATGGFSGTVTFTCSVSSGLSGTTCAIPGTVSTSGTATLIVTAPSAAQSPPWPGFHSFLNTDGSAPVLDMALCLLAALCVCAIAGRRARTTGIAIIAGALLSLTSCDEQSNDSTATVSIQPTNLTGTIVVSAASGALTHTVSVSVTVNESTSPTPLLTAEDVTSVVQNAAQAIDSIPAVIAVTDRLGNVLGVFRTPNTPATATGNFGATVDANELAVALARTAAFFSNDQAPLSSRTVRYISGIHFPPGISYTSNGALYGIENTNRGCPLNTTFLPGQNIPPARSIDGTHTGLGAITGKADVNDSDPNAVNPGGVPLFKSGALVGGVGVAGMPGPVAEYAAFSGAVGAGFGATPAAPGVVVINGISLPFVDQQTPPAGVQSGSFTGNWFVSATSSPAPAPEGYLVAAKAGPLGGLAQADVEAIVNATIAEANLTRAVIRLPDGSRARFAIAVADVDGTLIALYRMTDATVFSIDVAVAKSRNVIYFSGPNRQPSDLAGVPMGTAVTNRTIGFGAQPLFPPGIDGSGPGPFFDLYQFDTLNPCTQGQQPSNANQNGVVFFPGSVPLYRNGVLVGGLGVSGDGVDQDDFVADAGAAAFQAPAAIRADQVLIQGVRLPYQSFPRDPTN